MSLVLIALATTLCIGFAVLVHAMTNAPEGNEDSDGFGFATQAAKVHAFREPKARSASSANHVHGVTAA